MARHGRTVRRVGATLALAAAVALLQTDRVVQAARPGELARLVPSDALVLLESEDLPALAGRWHDGQLARRVEGTAAHGRCQASRLGLRLSDRLEQVEAALDGPVGMHRLARLPAGQGVLALYNISETRFVLLLRVARGSSWGRTVFGEQATVERRQVAGREATVHRGFEGRSSLLAVALVGDLLVVSNDLERFEAAVALAAGGGGASLAADPSYRALAARAPLAAQAHVYVDMEQVAASRQFRRYWVHGNAAELEGISRVMLSATFEDGRTVEDRVVSYRPGGRRLAAGEAGEADARLAVLPRGAYVAISAVGSPEAAADAARWVWPGGDAGTPLELARALAPGAPARALEVIRPALGAEGFLPADGLAVALALAEPSALVVEDLLAAASGAIERGLALGRRVTPARTTRRVGGHEVTSLAAPVPGWPSLSVARSSDGAVLVLASSEPLASELARAAAPGLALGAALRSAGPDVARVDLERARGLLAPRLRLIAGRRPDGEPARFLAEDTPELMGAGGVSRIERAAYREGELDRQRLGYLR